MFINEAFAATTTAPVGNLGGTFVQLALILLIFYFFLIRPQQKKIREHAEMVNALKVGDKVLTNGGIYGKVSKLEDSKVSLEVSAGVNIVVERMAISGIVDEKKNNAHAEKAEQNKKAKK